MSVIQDAIDQLQTEIRAISGIRAAPDEPPEAISVYPYVVGYVRDGTWESEFGAQIMKGLHNIVLELHVARGSDLTRAVVEAMGYSNSIPNAIFDAFRDLRLTTIDAFTTIAYTFGPMSWNGIDTFGFRFVINSVKMRETIT